MPLALTSCQEIENILRHVQDKIFWDAINFSCKNVVVLNNNFNIIWPFKMSLVLKQDKEIILTLNIII